VIEYPILEQIRYLPANVICGSLLWCTIVKPPT
jgi:hypothetical protein